MLMPKLLACFAAHSQNHLGLAGINLHAMRSINLENNMDSFEGKVDVRDVVCDETGVRVIHEKS